MTDLEQRRQAIIAALRAVMAEPLPRATSRATLPPPVTLPTTSAPSATIRELVARVRTPHSPTNGRTAAPTAEPTLVPASIGELLPMREALAAQIEWDETTDTPEVSETEEIPEVSETTAVHEVGKDAETSDDDDADDETPAVPPLELAGSMSRAASMALFGHA